jgi:3-oxoacyl-[acyl-carrier protein] reductase
LPIDFADISTLIAQKSALQNLGEISGLVIMPPQAPQSNNCFPSIEEWNDLFSRCFTNPVELIKAIIPQMGKAARGKVVIVSGISSAQVLSHYATSNVLRCAWLAQAKTMAFALGERNIHVNTVSLGGTLTEKYKAGIQTRGLDFGRTFEEQLVEETNNVPLRKYATPEEVSEVIAQMLGAFSDHISGVNLLCDGGFTRAY